MTTSADKRRNGDIAGEGENAARPQLFISTPVGADHPLAYGRIFRVLETGY